ncbi:TAXI family TRAP transporter solute-binding subunit (plasmid) [Thioclava sp. 'Guangxiensis']|uniref:TAXI family TRAP transporter solute-binding subunit n=1 Tax=Thioclava sp. 'Guangxiensis' TaxID=3149044 RepID=UPI0032C41E0C
MIKKLSSIVCLVLGLAAGSAQAQVLSLGTTAGGSTGQVGTAIAQTATNAGEIRVIPKETANTAQYIPMVDAGAVDFGIANYPQTAFAYSGTGMSEGQPNKNLRLVATMMDFTSGMLVYKASGINTVADFKGHKIPRFPDNSLGDFVIRAVLATADLTYDDVTPVPTANFPAMFEGLKDGSLDVSIATAGAAHVMDIEASGGPVKFVSLKPEDEAALDSVMPGTKIYDITGMDAAGVEGTTYIFGYDYMLFCNVNTPDAAVSAMAKALYENKKALVENSPMWDSFDPKTMARAKGIPYHPAAIAFYKSVGVPVPTTN